MADSAGEPAVAAPEMAPATPATAATAATPATRTERGTVPRPPQLGERLLAAVAHLATLLSLPGMLLALAIWLTHRGRSPYVSQQARQAVLWQVLSNVVLGIVVALLLGVAVSQLGAAMATKSGGTQGDITRLFSSLIGLYVVLFAALVYCCLSAVLGACCALLGRSFHYPIIGRKRKA